VLDTNTPFFIDAAPVQAWQSERGLAAGIGPIGLQGLGALDAITDDVFGLGAAIRPKKKKKKPTAQSNLAPAPLAPAPPITPAKPAPKPRPRVQALRRDLQAARATLQQTQGTLTTAQAQLARQTKQNQARARVNAKLRQKNQQVRQQLKARPAIVPGASSPIPSYSTMPVTPINYPDIPVDQSDFADFADPYDPGFDDPVYADGAGDPYAYEPEPDFPADEDWSALDPNSAFFMEPAGDGLDPYDGITTDDFIGAVDDESTDPALGSWLSKTFKKVTGTSLSSVAAPIAGAAAGLIPGAGVIAAPIVANVVGAVANRGASSPTQAVVNSLVPQPTAPATSPQSAIPKKPKKPKAAAAAGIGNPATLIALAAVGLLLMQKGR